MEEQQPQESQQITKKGISIGAAIVLGVSGIIIAAIIAGAILVSKGVDTVKDFDFESLDGFEVKVDDNGEKTTVNVEVQEGDTIKGLDVLDKSLGNPSARSFNRYAIVGTELKSESTNPTCGRSNEFMSPCTFFVEQVSGDILEISEWPNQNVLEQYPDLFVGNNFYIDQSVYFSDDDIVSFDTELEYSCSEQHQQRWSLNVNTGEFVFQGQDKTLLDGC